MESPGIERVRERTHDVLLPDQLGKAARAPFAREGLIRHASGDCSKRVKAQQIVERGRLRGSARFVPKSPFSLCLPGTASILRGPQKVRGRVRRCGRGEVSEWLKEHAWKVCKRLIPASRVRIPPSPPPRNLR